MALVGCDEECDVDSDISKAQRSDSTFSQLQQSTGKEPVE